MILVIINMRVSVEKRKELTQAVTSLLNIIRGEKGCRRCDFFQDMEDENMLCLLEEWDTPGNFEIHRKSECFKVLRGAMNLLEESGQITTHSSVPGATSLTMNKQVTNLT